MNIIHQIIGSVTSDITGLAVQIFFAFTVLLMIFDRQKPPLLTGILTGVALTILGLGGSFSSLATAAVSVLNGFLWLILAWQRYRQA